MTLEKLKVDPAIATGPFISITNDIIGMMMYMGITVLLAWNGKIEKKQWKKYEVIILFH